MKWDELGVQAMLLTGFARVQPLFKQDPPPTRTLQFAGDAAKPEDKTAMGSVPKQARMIGHSAASSLQGNNGSSHYRQQLYIIWNKVQNCFRILEKMTWLDYTDTKTYKNCRSTDHEMKLNHGDVLGADFIPGTLVDQVNQRLILPDGRWIDGPTGDVYSAHDEKLISRDPAQQNKKWESKEC